MIPRGPVPVGKLGADASKQSIQSDARPTDLQPGLLVKLRPASRIVACPMAPPIRMALLLITFVAGGCLGPRSATEGWMAAAMRPADPAAVAQEKSEYGLPPGARRWSLGLSGAWGLSGPYKDRTLTESVDDVGTGVGGALRLGLDLSKRARVELLYLRLEGDLETTDLDGGAAGMGPFRSECVQLGYQRLFPSERTWQPFFSYGLGYSRQEFESIGLLRRGIGAYVGGGAEWRLSERVRLHGGLNLFYAGLDANMATTLVGIEVSF